MIQIQLRSERFQEVVVVRFSARVRSLTLNNASRFGDTQLTEKVDSLKFSVLGYSQEIANTFENTFSINSNGEFNQITGHSPIIGWAYDGNPIYGPFWIF